MSKEPMTSHGYEKLCRELKNLKEVERPEIVKEIDEARAHGDLKENAEYHAAKEKQAFIEARIAELSNLVSIAQIVDPSTYAHEVVSFGSKVRLLNLDTQKEFSYTIVGTYESNPARGHISFYSPISKSIIGRKSGDSISINLPRGREEFEILEVSFEEIIFE